MDELLADPTDRRRMANYNPNDCDKIRRAYLQRSPHQPCHQRFLKQSLWGFKNGKKLDRFQRHIGRIKSSHNQCRLKCEDLMNENQHIGYSFAKQSDQINRENETRLLASIDCLAFRDHGELKDSKNVGNFKELLKFLGDHNEETRKSLAERRVDGQLPSTFCLLIIFNQISHQLVLLRLFSILIDECLDVSTKEQMTHVIQYVNMKGCVIERFLGIAHYSTNFQGYDGASNMRIEFNGLKSLFLKDNIIIGVAKNDPDVASLFTMISRLVNIVGGSCKCKDILRKKQAHKVKEAIDIGEIKSSKGLHQEYTLQRAMDTRWSFHFRALVNIGIMFPYILEVLEYVFEDEASLEQKGDAKQLLASFGII
ncbi:hypothetical protein OSB04_001530 [Centaurea solstitialis]|uniref:DUF4371 domain-containing protein n=1 Tax=Centaurea solstitialis TaxID=347529 RepID=A0AA38WUH5_9ASTR|nr:hypothetical protein OSB04_001530 [Centaurea solstitialis]